MATKCAVYVLPVARWGTSHHSVHSGVRATLFLLTSRVVLRCARYWLRYSKENIASANRLRSKLAVVDVHRAIARNVASYCWLDYKVVNRCTSYSYSTNRCLAGPVG